MRSLIAFVATVVFSLVLTVLAPDVMVKPGELSAGHQSLNRDCFRCHAALRGATVESCVSCHRPADIGLRTVAGAAVPAGGPRKVKVAFHAGLAQSDCTACHLLHTSERHRREPVFRHELLAAADRQDCASCHRGQRPSNPLHERVQDACGACHTTETWKGATFDHRRVAGAVACAACHQKDRPADELHRQVTTGCASCHGTTAWRPATFEHSRYFRFDAHHPSDCRTCHTDPATFSTYSCFGCHAHTPAGIAAEHREEGIRNFDDCVRCHRSGTEGEVEGGEGGEGRGERRGGRHGEEEGVDDD